MSILAIVWLLLVPSHVGERLPLSASISSSDSTVQKLGSDWGFWFSHTQLSSMINQPSSTISFEMWGAPHFKDSSVGGICFSKEIERNLLNQHRRMVFNYSFFFPSKSKESSSSHRTQEASPTRTLSRSTIQFGIFQSCARRRGPNIEVSRQLALRGWCA